MKKTILCGALALLFALSGFAQTAPATTATMLNSVTMPTYIAGGVAFNQLGSPRTNLWVAGLIPVVKQVGMYLSTTADITPVAKVDTVSGRIVYTVASQMRAGLHKTLYTGKKVQLLVGGDIGASISSNTTSIAATGTSNLNVSLATSVTGTLVYQLNPHWGVIFPLRALYVQTLGGWNPIIEAGVVWKP